jgi:hypothetical protein
MCIFHIQCPWFLEIQNDPSNTAQECYVVVGLIQKTSPTHMFGRRKYTKCNIQIQLDIYKCYIYKH